MLLRSAPVVDDIRQLQGFPTFRSQLRVKHRKQVFPVQFERIETENQAQKPCGEAHRLRMSYPSHKAGPACNSDKECGRCPVLAKNLHQKSANGVIFKRLRVHVSLNLGKKTAHKFDVLFVDASPQFPLFIDRI